jgi:hypothetical protein
MRFNTSLRGYLGGRQPVASVANDIFEDAGQMMLKGEMKDINHEIDTLDLSPIKFKLVDPRHGHGWPLARANKAEADYKLFLRLNYLVGDEEIIVPGSDVDEFWHYHILDTRKYEADCLRLFGRLIHHYPYFGMKDADDAERLKSATERTRILYEQILGVQMEVGGVVCNSGPGSKNGPETEWRPDYNDCLAVEMSRQHNAH